MDFPTLLRRQHAVIDHFIEVLEQEQAVLTAPTADLERLSGIAESKSACAGKLEELDRVRRTVMAKMGYATDRKATEKLARACGCLPQWQAFIERVSEAHARNEMNGAVINQRLEYNQDALSFLNTISGSGLYGPDGQTSGGGKHLHDSV